MDDCDQLPVPADWNPIVAAPAQSAFVAVMAGFVSMGIVYILTEHGRTGLLVAPDDAAAIADAVAGLAADPATRAEYGWSARAAVAGRTRQAVGDELIGHDVAVHSGHLDLAPAQLPAQSSAPESASLPS